MFRGAPLIKVKLPLKAIVNQLERVLIATDKSNLAAITSLISSENIAGFKVTTGLHDETVPLQLFDGSLFIFIALSIFTT